MTCKLNADDSQMAKKLTHYDSRLNTNSTIGRDIDLSVFYFLIKIFSPLLVDDEKF